MFSMNFEAESGEMPSTYTQSSEYTFQHMDMSKETLSSRAHSGSSSFVKVCIKQLHKHLMTPL